MKFFNKRSASKFGVSRIEVTLDCLGSWNHGKVVWGDDGQGKVEEYFFDSHKKIFLNKKDFEVAKKAHAAQRRITHKTPWPSSEGRLMRQGRQGWHYKERSCA